MAKIHGVIGYAETVETEPGFYEEVISDKPYYGELIRNTRLLQGSGGVNDNVNIANQVSIVADPYANYHIHEMRYIEFLGAKWKITNVEVQYPRLILSVGGLYNEQTTRIAE